MKPTFLGTSAGREEPHPLPPALPRNPYFHRPRDTRSHTRTVAADHDSRYKMLFSHPLFVQRLLESFVEEPFTAHLDYSTLERVNASFVSEEFARRESVSDVAEITELSETRVRALRKENDTR